MRKICTILLAIVVLAISHPIYGAETTVSLNSNKINVDTLGGTVQFALSTEAVSDLLTLQKRGATIVMQWYRLSNRMIGGSFVETAISGETKATLSLPVVSNIFNYRYFCRIGIKLGTQTTTSNTEIGSVVSNAKIITQPANVSVKKTGSAAKFTISATGIGITYQWYKNGVAIASATGITGETTNQLIVNQSTADVKTGDKFYCVVTAPHGTNATSEEATLTITSEVVTTLALSKNELNVSALGETVRFTFAMTVVNDFEKLKSMGASILYQWYAQLPGKPKTKISDETNAYLELTVSDTKLFSALYTCDVTIMMSDKTQTFSSEEGTLLSNATITTQPTSISTKRSNTAAQLTIEATGVGITYQWYKNGSAITGEVGISGESTKTLVVDMTKADIEETDKFKCILTAPYGRNATSDEVSFTIEEDANYQYFNVCGTEVTNLNEDNIVPIDGSLVAGKIYMKEDTLFLKDVVVETSNNFLELGEGHSVGYIKVLGNCDVECEDFIVYEHDMVGASILTGPGQLNIYANNYVFNGTSGAYHRIESANIKVYTAYCLVEQCYLNIDYSILDINTYFALDSKEYCGLNLSNCEIATKGVSYDDTKKIFTDGTNEVKNVLITYESAVNYDLMVLGIQVSSKNNEDVLNDGTVSYDPENNVLTLNNAELESLDAFMNGIEIYEMSFPITIKLIGENIINTASAGIKSINNDLVIEGEGTLSTTSKGDCGIYVNAGKLTIKADVEAKGFWGIAGNETYLGELVIDNAHVTCSTTNEAKASICDFSSISFVDVMILTPEGSAYDATLKGIAKDGALVNTEIKIVPSYQLTVTAGLGGSVDSNLSAAYPEGKIIELAATADEGYKFVNWTVDNVEVSTENPYTITITEDLTIVANFEEIPNGLNNIQRGVSVEKRVISGEVIIIKNGGQYTVLGQKK